MGKKQEKQLVSSNKTEKDKVLTRKRSRDITQDIDSQIQEKISTKPKKTNKLINMNKDDEPEIIQQEFQENELENYIEDTKTISVLKKAGIKHLFPIQAECYHPIYEGHDLIGKDRTGSGKTLAFAIPIIEKMRKNNFFKEQDDENGHSKQQRNWQRKNKIRNPVALILLPTRELAIQVGKEFNRIKHSDNEYKVVTVYGGTDVRQQSDELKDGCDIIVGTPGRIMDQYNRQNLNFEKIQIICLDEADQMLQFGFQEDVEKIFGFIKEQIQIKKAQVLLFSATIPRWLHDIARNYMDTNRKFVDMIAKSGVKTATTVEHLAINCPWYQRTEIIGDVIVAHGGGQKSRCIIFCETKKEANDIMLSGNIKQDCQVLHGDIPQKQREITFHGFKEGKFKCLIATNVASRGLDIPQVDLVIQLEPPKETDTYIHRSGRTARAGKKGVCITFYSKKHQELLDRIERKAQMKFKKIGAPQPIDILKASCNDIVTSLKTVSSNALEIFKEASQELIDEIGAEEALSRAIAYISGYTDKMTQRSLLCSVEGYITIILRVNKPFNGIGFVWTFLRNQFSTQLTDNIKGMRKLKGNLGAIFDVAEQDKQEIDKYIQEYDPEGKGFPLEIATEIPDLENDTTFTTSNLNNNNNNFSRGNRGGNQDRVPSDVFKNKDNLEIFVGGLPFNCEESQFQDHFRKINVEFYTVRMLRDGETQKFKGAIFALCKNEQMVQRALQENGKFFQGRALRINMSNDKRRH